MNDDSKYKPFLAGDKEYLKKVAGIIEERPPVEEIHFEYLNELFESLGFQQNPYTLVSPDDLNMAPIQEFVTQAFEKINSGQLNQEVEQRLSRLWDYLAEADPVEPTDLIFVFGGPGEHRAKEAITLYKQGLASKILFTGKKAAYMKDPELTEAEYYARIARIEGVPEEDLLIENEAINTPENAVNSVALLKKQNLFPSSMIIVTLPYHMRRSYLTLKAVASGNPKLIRHPVPSAKYTRENYFKDKNGLSYIIFEFIKIYAARMMKHF